MTTALLLLLLVACAAPPPTPPEVVSTPVVAPPPQTEPVVVVEEKEAEKEKQPACYCFTWVHLHENGQNCFATHAQCTAEFKTFGRNDKLPCAKETERCSTYACRHGGKECRRFSSP